MSINVRNEGTPTSASDHPSFGPHRLLRVLCAGCGDVLSLTELAVRDVVHGRAVKNTEALANSEALKLYEGLGELRS